jgi:ppGpp synthetase/RelA/SpoT-type nucleotidyltranferase
MAEPIAGGGGHSTQPTQHDDVLKYYSYWLPLCKRLRQVAIGLIEECLARERIKVDAITGRTKSFESFLDKIQRTQKPYREIHDLVGLRVVCLFRSDIERVGQLICREFLSLPGLEDNKFDTKPVETFGYLDRKFIVKLHPNFTGNWREYLGIRDLPFEIQIKTIGMHAWASVSHYIDYKTDEEIPRALERDFQALSALFHIADSQFEAFVKAKKDLGQLQGVGPAPSLESDITVEGLVEYIVRRFPDRNYNPASGHVSRLFVEMSRAYIHRLRDIETALDRWLPAINLWEAQGGVEIKEPGKGKQTRFSAVALIRIALAEQYPAYANFCQVVRLPEPYRNRLLDQSGKLGSGS